VPVSIDNLSFNPADVTVPTGSTVVWTNDDSVPHTVTAADGSFDSGIFDPGSGFTWTFDQPGTFPYACQLHPQMQGTVRVEGGRVGVALEDAPAAAGATPALSASGPEPQVATPVARSSASGGALVSIVDFAFEPGTLELAAGATIVWTNVGQAPHTVTSTDGLFDSGVLEPGQTFSHTFADVGSFAYSCAIHPDMTGTITIGAVAAPQAVAQESAVGTINPEGVWIVALLPDDVALLGAQEALFTLHGDGTVEADFAAAPGDEAAVMFLTSGHGEWRSDDDGLALTLVTLFSGPDRRFAGRLTLDAQGQIAPDGALDGTFAFALSTADEEAIGSGTGTLRGVPFQPGDP
jgi:plastocyanin